MPDFKNKETNCSLVDEQEKSHWWVPTSSTALRLVHHARSHLRSRSIMSHHHPILFPFFPLPLSPISILITSDSTIRCCPSTACASVSSSTTNTPTPTPTSTPCRTRTCTDTSIGIGIERQFQLGGPVHGTTISISSSCTNTTRHRRTDARCVRRRGLTVTSSPSVEIVVVVVILGGVVIKIRRGGGRAEMGVLVREIFDGVSTCSLYVHTWMS